MKTGSYEHLESYCAGKGIICQRIGKRIKLTTPDGGTTAEETSVRDAWSTVKTDPTFCDLPIQVLRRPPAPQPVRVDQQERYEYRFYNRSGEVLGPRCLAESLDQALRFAGFEAWTVDQQFAEMAVIKLISTGATLGVKWQRI